MSLFKNHHQKFLFKITACVVSGPLISPWMYVYSIYRSLNVLIITPSGVHEDPISPLLMAMFGQQKGDIMSICYHTMEEKKCALIASNIDKGFVTGWNLPV